MPRLKRRLSATPKEYDELVDSVVVDSFQRPSPPVVYHYTDEAGLFGILKDRCIRATHYSKLEDTLELQHLDAHVYPVVDSLLEDYRDTFAGTVLDGFRANYERMKATVIPDFAIHIACFCRQPDEPYLWKKFGRGGAGFCLGFQTLKEELNHVPGIEALGIPIEYSARAQQEKLTRAYREILRPLVKTPRAQPNALRRMAINGMARIATFASVSTKAPRFSQEQEWRLVVWPRHQHELDTLDNPSRIAWPLRQDKQLPVLASVHVGARRNPSDIDRVRRQLDELGYGQRGNRLPTVAMSASPSTT